MDTNTLDFQELSDQQQQAREDSPGNLLDTIMRKMAVLNLNDYFIGSYINYPNRKVEVLFSDRIPAQYLEDLQNSIGGDSFNVWVEKTEVEGAAFVLKAGLKDQLGPDDVNVDGNVTVGVELTGDVDVDS